MFATDGTIKAATEPLVQDSVRESQKKSFTFNNMIEATSNQKLIYWSIYESNYIANILYYPAVQKSHFDNNSLQ